MRAIRVAWVFVVIVALCGHCRAQEVRVMGMTPHEEDGHRGDLLEELISAEEAFRSDPEDGARYEYASLLMEAGRFERASEVVAPLLDSVPPSDEALSLGARLAYWMGDYERAQSLFGEILAPEPNDARALTGLAMTYYQTNDFAACAGLSEEQRGAVMLPMLDLMLAFGEEDPYSAEWDEDRSSTVPFITTDPLPVVEVEIDGRRLAALIDTGADLFILDTDIADELGIESLTTMLGMFAGGKRAEIGFARAGSLRLGDVTLRSVPISILPTKPLSLGDVEIGGIIGTGVLRQFVSTMDYPNSRLVLRERSDKGLAASLDALDGLVVESVPFYLEGSHFILAHGSLNGSEGLLFLVDSGLAGVPAFGAPRQTLEYVGIPVPEVSVREDVIGGAGGGFAVGEFEIEELGLGSLRQKDLVGSFGGQPPGSYRRAGFIKDGLISHNFVKHYVWTLDFDGMTMYLARDANASSGG